MGRSAPHPLLGQIILYPGLLLERFHRLGTVKKRSRINLKLDLLDNIGLILYNTAMNEMSALSLLKSLGQANRLAETRLEAALAVLGLSVAKLGVLRVLIQAGEPLPLGQVAERLACVKSNVTQLIDRLEADGLVQRGADPADRRSIRAAITAEGRRRYDLGVREEARISQDLFEGLVPSEREALAALLQRFTASER